MSDLFNTTFSAAGISVYYGSTCAVDNVSFDLMPGQLNAVIGNNGCGKTSLIKAIMGLIKHNGKCQLNEHLLFHIHSILFFDIIFRIFTTLGFITLHIRLLFFRIAAARQGNHKKSKGYITNGFPFLHMFYYTTQNSGILWKNYLHQTFFSKTPRPSLLIVNQILFPFRSNVFFNACSVGIIDAIRTIH